MEHKQDPATAEGADYGVAVDLRSKAVDELVRGGAIKTPAIASVLRKVPRHLAVPEAPVEAAYRPYDAVITKRDAYGISQSSLSAMQIQAMQLEQAAISLGMRGLEIGSGGVNAAYIAELIGPSGELTSIDIDPEVTERAVRFLSETGYGDRVRVVLADAGAPLPVDGLLDFIIVTAGAWDIAPAWLESLSEGGRLVVPLRMRGLTRSISFVREGERLSSSSAEVCGFVPMQGQGAHEEQLLLLNGTGEIGLRFDDGLPPEPALLDDTLRSPRVEVWTGVTVGRTEPIGTFQLYLATMLDGFCVMAVDMDLDTGLVAPSNSGFSLAAVDGSNFAYILTRRMDDETVVEFGVHSFGPDADAFAATMAGHVRTWAEEFRGGSGPQITVYPTGTPGDRIAGERIIDKKHTRISLSWSAAIAVADQAALHHPNWFRGE